MPYRKFVSRATSLLFVIALSGLIFSSGRLDAQIPNSSKPKNEKKFKPISGHIILISISGLRADFANDPKGFRLRIPTIQSLRLKGAYAIGVESVFPSQTIPAHATLVTGTLPADHGITSDYQFDIQTGVQASAPFHSTRVIRTETLWEYLRREGLTTAAAGFPLTTGAAINFNLHNPMPDESEADAELRKVLMTALNKKADNRGSRAKTDQIIQPEDLFNADAISYLIEKYRPNVSMVNFVSLDLAQQRHGLLSEQAALALERIDGFIAGIGDAIKRAGIDSNSTLIIISDHGASKVEHEFRPNVLLARKGFLSADDKSEINSWRAVAQTYGGSAAIYVRNPQDEKFVGEVENLFLEQHQKPDSPIWRVIPRHDAARLGADPRAVLYLDGSPGYAMSPATTGASITNSERRAAHGYSPSRSEMRAALVVSGCGIKAGTRLEYARLIDIAPTIARLLGLEMKTARGRVLSELLVN